MFFVIAGQLKVDVYVNHGLLTVHGMYIIIYKDIYFNSFINKHSLLIYY